MAVLSVRANALAEKMNKALDEAYKLSSLAHTYAEDGAFSTAAERLRKAARALDRAAKYKAQYWEELKK